MQIRKDEVEIFLSTSDMVLYMENSQESKENLL